MLGVITVDVPMSNLNKQPKDRQICKNRPRKILSLEERVQALRMFDQTPVYQRVATAFGCSWEQIKNVVLSRQEIMGFYARCQTIRPKDHPNQVRKKKILFLGNVVFEYIKRALYHGNEVLDETKIRECALEFRDEIEIEKFYPNTAWFNDFKRVYNIDFACTDNIVLSQPPPKSLLCQDIIEYCRNEIEQILKGNIKTVDSHKEDGHSAEQESSAENNELEDNETKLNGKNTTKRKVDFNEEDIEDDINEDEEGETIDFSQFDENEICDSTKSEIEPRRKKQKSNDDYDQQTCKKNVKAKQTLARKPPATLTTDSAATTTTPTRNAKSPTAQSSEATVTYTKEQPDIEHSLRSIKEERRSISPESLDVPNSEPPRATVIRAPSISTTTAASATTNLNARGSYNDTSIPPQIFDSKAALSHLFPLQDFALAEEDFVAINLLQKLAAHYSGNLKINEPRGTECSENN